LLLSSIFYLSSLFLSVALRVQPTDPNESGDPLWGTRVGITVMLALCAAAGLGMVLMQYVMAPVKASRLR